MASLPTLICLLVIAGTVIMTADSFVIKNGWVHATSKLKYRVTTSKLNWHAARHWCQSRGGDLASSGMRDYWTRVTIANVVLLRDERYWIGLNDLRYESTWMWVDGKRAYPSNIHWWNGEPNNNRNEDCGEINESRDFRTNDGQCSQERYGLCEAKI